tara:strand:- start:169285 stop:169698 length:414 start_codon:yes stop_codon:yes gene_type:complete
MLKQFTPEQLEEIEKARQEAMYEAKVLAFRHIKNGRVFPYSATLFKHRVKMHLTPLTELPEELVPVPVAEVIDDGEPTVGEMKALLAIANSNLAAALENKTPLVSGGTQAPVAPEMPPLAEAKPKAATSRRAKAEQE